MHDVSIFRMDCERCRELFENRRAYNTHLRKCGTTTPPHDRPARCVTCGTRYIRPESLRLHESCCVRPTAPPPPNGRHGTRDHLPVLRKALAKSDEPRPARPKQAYGRITASQEPRAEWDRTDATAVDGGKEGNLPRSGGQGGVVQPHIDRFPPRDDDPSDTELQNKVSPLALAGPHHADRHTRAYRLARADEPARTEGPDRGRTTRGGELDRTGGP